MLTANDPVLRVIVAAFVCVAYIFRWVLKLYSDTAHSFPRFSQNAPPPKPVSSAGSIIVGGLILGALAYWVYPHVFG